MRYNAAIMGFKVNYRGLSVECTSVDDLDVLADRLSKSRSAAGIQEVRRQPEQSRPASNPTLDGASTGSWPGDLRESLAGYQRKVMGVLIEIFPKRIEDSVLRERCGIPQNGMGGVFAGLSKNAKKYGFTLEDVISKHSRRDEEGNRIIEYEMNPKYVALLRKGLGQQEGDVPEWTNGTD